MLFLLLGFGILAASTASWVSLLADPAFSDAILQNGLLTFWWKSLTVLVEQPEFLVSAPSLAIPLLAASVGPFVGLPVAGMGMLALWRRPKEIEVKGRPQRPARPEIFRLVEEKAPARNTALVEQEHITPSPPGWEQTAARDLETPKKVEEEVGTHRRKETAAVVAQKAAAIGDAIGAAVSGLFGRLRQKAAEAAERSPAIGAAVSGLFGQLRRQTTETAERGAVRRAAQADRKAVEVPRAQAEPQRMAEKTSEEGVDQPLPDRIMAWYAAWVTVRAGQRPPKMLEDARRLAAELDPQTRSAMINFGMRGATALSMLESAAAVGMARASSEEEEEFLTPSQSGEGRPVNPDEFMREVEPPEAYDGEAVPSASEAGPVHIEDDIALPAPSAESVSCGVGSDETSGPMVIEDDIGAPTIDWGAGGPVEEVAMHRVMNTREREEIKIPLEESEFLPAPGTVEPVAGVVATTTTMGWDEVSITGPSVPETHTAAYPEVPADEADTDAFLAEASLAGAAPEMHPTGVTSEGIMIRSEEAAYLLSPSNRMSEAEEPVQEESLPVPSGTPESGKEESEPTIPASPTASVRVEEAAAPEAVSIKEPFAEEVPETFPSGVAPTTQEAVIGQLLADPRRRATILGEREGTPAWTLRHLELHGLLGLSDKSNPAVVRMWEAIDRLVAYQARIFAWENLKETPPPEFDTHEKRVAHVIDLAREVVAERSRVSTDLLEEIRRLKAGTEHVAWMEDRVDLLLAAMTSPKVVEQLEDFLPKPEEGKAQAGGRLLKVMAGHRDPEPPALVQVPYEELLAASHDIHQRYKEICKSLMVPLYRSLSVKVKEKDGRPAYAQIELVMGDVASVKQRNAVPEGAIGVIFVIVPPGRWQVAEAAGRAGQDRLVLEGVRENAGRLIKIRDSSLEIFHRWVESRNMRPYGVVHLLCGEGTAVEGIDRRWGDIEFVRNPWGQKDIEALQRSRLRPKAE